MECDITFVYACIMNAYRDLTKLTCELRSLSVKWNHNTNILDLLYQDITFLGKLLIMTPVELMSVDSVTTGSHISCHLKIKTLTFHNATAAPVCVWYNAVVYFFLKVRLESWNLLHQNNITYAHKCFIFKLTISKVKRFLRKVINYYHMIGYGRSHIALKEGPPFSSWKCNLQRANWTNPV